MMIASVGVLLLWAMFGHLDRLGSWGSAEVLFSWGFAEAAVGLFHVCFQGLFSMNQRYILGGELDRVLVRPLDPLAAILLDNVSYEDLPQIALGALVMALVAPELPELSLWKLAVLPILLVGATAVLGGVLTLVSSVGFHLHHRGTAVGLLFQLSTFNRYPIDLFARPLRWLLTFVLPLGFAGFYPASLYLGQPGWAPWALATPFVGALSLWVGWKGWRHGLRRYTSSGT